MIPNNLVIPHPLDSLSYCLKTWNIPSTDAFRFSFSKKTTSGENIPLIARSNPAQDPPQRFHWWYSFKLHKTSCTKNSKCCSIKPGEIIRFEIDANHHIELAVDKPIIKKKARTSQSSRQRRMTSSSSSQSHADEASGITMGYIPTSRVYLCRRKPWFFTDLWLPTYCPQVRVKLRAVEFSSIQSELEIAPSNSSNWMNDIEKLKKREFGVMDAIMIYEQCNVAFKPYWTSLLLELVPNHKLPTSTLPVINSVYVGRFSTLQKSSNSPLIQYDSQPLHFIGYNLHTPTIIILQNNINTFTFEPRRRVYNSLIIDFPWTADSPGTYKVFIANTTKLKMNHYHGLLKLSYSNGDVIAIFIRNESNHDQEVLPVTRGRRKSEAMSWTLDDGDEQHGVLSLIMHLVLPYLGQFNTEGIRNISLVNRAFFRYICRVRKFQTHYQEIIKHKDKKWRALHYTSSFGDYRRLKDTFRNASEKNLQQPEDGVSALFYALQNGHSTIFRFVGKLYHKSLLQQTHDGVTLLHIAALHGRITLMKWLLTNTDLLEKTTLSTKETPLFYAVLSQNQMAVSLLIQFGADVSKVNYNGITAEVLAQNMGLKLEFKKLNDMITDVPKRWSEAILSTPRTSRQAKSLDMFEIKQKLGQGAFGEVFLAVDKTSGKEVALKQMYKAHIKELNKKEHVDNEKRILQQAQQLKIKYMVHLHVAFQSEDILYIAMDYCPGGDLQELLEVIGVLEESEAKIWFAEMCCAVHSLHELNYIHRDLKPENFFIDARGHIKLGDFGLSAADKQRKPVSVIQSPIPFYGKERSKLTVDNFSQRFHYNTVTSGGINPQRRATKVNPLAIPTAHKLQAHSCVGTPQYMSPEVVAQRAKVGDITEFRKADGYSFEVDWWSLGCVFYTCILGGPPFSGDSPEEIFNSVTHWEQLLPEVLGQFEDNLSKECYSLLAGFLTDSSRRLGKDFARLKQHKFFEGLDWDKLDQEKTNYVPLVSASDK